jgi:hypothetical protein
MVPFMGAAIPISLKCEPNALSQDKWLIGAPTRSRRTVVGADERRLADRGASGEYTLFLPREGDITAARFCIAGQ